MLSGNFDNGMTHEFLRDDNSYSFRGSFHVCADPECLIQVIYKFEHISKYTSGARSIEIIREGDNWYEVRYVYRRYIIFENTSSWRRILKQDEQKVVFEMISNESNLDILPEILSSNGYYQITPGEKSCRIEYYQECTLKKGFFRESFIKRAEDEAVEFLRVFLDYIGKTCEIQ